MKGGENLSKKKNRNKSQTRSTVGDKISPLILSSADFPGLMFPPGYSRLSDNPDVRIATDRIADMVSNMTIHLMENTEKGDKRVRNELSRKLDVNPYSYMTRKNWIYKICSDLLLYGDGNSIVLPILKNGLIDQLKPLRMDSISYNDLDDGYEINCNGVVFQPDEVIHFAINPDPCYPYRGTGYRIVLRDLVQNLKQATKTKNSFMSGQYMPNIVVKVDALSEEMASNAGREQIKNKYLGESKPGEPWIIPAELLEVQQVKPLTLKDIAINESVELDKKTVAGLLGVPPFLLGVGTFSQSEHNNWIDTRIMSIAQIIAQTLTRDLLISPTMYFKLNPRSLYAYNLTEMVAAGTAMIDRNSMRRNELRDWVGLTPDAEMEELLVLENYLKQQDLDKQKKLKGGDED